MRTEHALDVGGLRLRAVEEGTGPAVVFGHGLLYDGRIFEPQARALAGDHRVVVLDFRGHGGSGIPPGAWTIGDHVRDYVTAMDALGIERAAVVGHSLGGMAALHVALEHPDRVRALVLIAASAAAETLVKRGRYLTLAAIARVFGMQPWLLREASKAMFGATYRRTEPKRVKRWLGLPAQMEPAVLYRAVRMVTARPSVTRRLPEIRAPALILVGTEDETTPPPRARAMAQGIPDARLEVLPRAGHMLTIERPEETARLIGSFLREIGA